MAQIEADAKRLRDAYAGERAMEIVGKENEVLKVSESVPHLWITDPDHSDRSPVIGLAPVARGLRGAQRAPARHLRLVPLHEHGARPAGVD